MFTTISTTRFSGGSVYKLWLIGLSASMIPLGVLFGAGFLGSAAALGLWLYSKFRPITLIVKGVAKPAVEGR